MPCSDGVMNGFSHRRLEQVGSTNDEARRLTQTGAAADCLVVSARTQTGGRGRSGRQWSSPEGNLYCSILVDINGNLRTAAQISFVVAVAVAEAVQALLPQAAVRVKWPNDLLIGATSAALGKGSGILLEAEGDRWLIVGIGINVVTAPPASEALYPPQCLRDLGFVGTDQDVLAALMPRFTHWLDLWRQYGLAPVLQQWRGLAHGIGGPIRVRLDTETLEGVFVNVDAGGGLILDQAGQRRTILAGDVFFPTVKPS